MKGQQQEANQEGFLLLVNDGEEQILVDVKRQFGKRAVGQVSKDDEVVLRAVVFDAAKGQPFDTGE